MAVVVLFAVLAACRNESPRSAGTGAGGPVGANASLALDALPDTRHGHRAEVLGDGRVLVFGGFARGDTGASRGAHASWILDPRLGAWRRTGDLAVPLAVHGSAVHGGAVDDGIDDRGAVDDGAADRGAVDDFTIDDRTVYAVGEGRVQRFDAASETWHVLVVDERIPTSHLGAAVVDGRLYAIGFGAAVVDLETLAVRELPPPPDHHPRDHVAHVVALGGRLHLLGGFGGEDFQPRTRHVVFDGTTWSRAADAPFPVDAKFGTCVAHGGALHVLGMDGNARYDLASDTWEPLPPSPWSDHRAMAAAFVDEGRLFVLGGLGAGRVHGVDVFDLEERGWIAPEGDRHGDRDGRRAE